MKKLLLLFIPLVFFFSCEEDGPQAMPMNNCGIVNLSIDDEQSVQVFNGESQYGYECALNSIYQTVGGVVCNISIWLSLYNDSGELKYWLHFNAFKETWGDFPNAVNNPFDPYEIEFDDYENLSVYSAGDNPIPNDGNVNYTIDYDNQTLSGEFNINIDPDNQAQNNPINISGDFSDIPFILYTQ